MYEIYNTSWGTLGPLVTARLTKLSDEDAKELYESGKLKFQQEKNERVQAVYIYNIPKFSRIPSNLSELFPNATALNITNCKLKKISRNDLQQFKSLKGLYLIGTEIGKIPADLFADHKDIEYLSIENIRIKFIEEDIFKNLKKLKYVSLAKNPKIYLIYADKDVKDLNLPADTTRIFKLEELNAILNGIFHQNHLGLKKRILIDFLVPMNLGILS